jgi:Domain of unknown function (DUF4185)
LSTRREFFAQATAGIVTATSLQLACSAKGNAISSSSKDAPHATYPAGSSITSVSRREETTLRLGGHGAEWHMSWAADDRQFVSLGGGMGWSDNPERVYVSRLLAIRNGPQDATFQDISGYPDLLQSEGGENAPPAYVSFGTMALDGHIYQFLNTFDRGTPSARVRHFIGTKLIYSPDNGRTWCNQDGSTPVVWEGWESRSRKSMLFFEEPQNAFSMLSVLQMGRNYGDNRDGFVYIYAGNGNTEGTMNQLVLCRVAKARILDRAGYEFFSGLKSGGSATWTRDINARAVVHTFPSGWVNTTGVPHAWQPSVAYNAPLGVYMMANWGNGIAPDGAGFAKPCYIGFWTAPNPWGPWTQIHEGTAWTPGNDPGSRAYMPIIAPKWIAKDGKSFWIVWSDLQRKGSKEELERFRKESKQMNPQDRVRAMRRMMPYYSFNTQRVDLVVA